MYEKILQCSFIIIILKEDWKRHIFIEWYKFIEKF